MYKNYKPRITWLTLLANSVNQVSMVSATSDLCKHCCIDLDIEYTCIYNCKYLHEHI